MYRSAFIRISSPRPPIAFLMALAVGVSLLLGASWARACNPFQGTCTTTIPPDNTFSGWLSVQVASSGCSGLGAGGGVQIPRSCGGFVQIPAGTSIVQKCNAIVSELQVDCGTATLGSSSLTIDGSLCSMGEFKVIDPICTGHTANGKGVSILIASSPSLTGNFTYQGSGTLEDYEADTIANDCQASSGDSLAMLNGSSTGSPINGNSPSVVFVVSTNDIGQVIETVPTTKGMTADTIVAQGVARANATLTAFGSSVRCTQDSVTPIVASCLVTGGDGGTVSVADAPVLGASVSFQVNDTGIQRATVAGPSQDIATARTIIHQSGGIQNAPALNFVGGGTTCSPCDGGVGSPTCCVKTPTVPAMGGGGVAVLFLVLGLIGLALVGQSMRRLRS